MILDKSKFKINKFTPGSGIKIVDENIKIKPDAQLYCRGILQNIY